MGILSHILRVFLIDPEGSIRNIYSASFLHADTLINDVKTVLLDSPVFTQTQTKTNILQTNTDVVMGLPRAGDDKNWL